ncbi:MAG TPA: acyl-CoA thioester hydrolase/BAAT C-terminal domain-containing protein [Terriglobales bacterium]|nr:acyl-CoA thioester hydrolase/BAAT C-terminal domain-containing protein [Terriglobales bacterium]
MSSEDVDSANSLLNKGLVGRFRLPAGRSRSPGLLVLAGAEGGLESADKLAEQFAGEGFASLALAYFGAPSLPAMLEEIPLEYFHKAIDWLREAPGVDGGHVGVAGHSKGGEAALLVGASAPQVRAVVAYVPSHVVWESLSFQSPPRSSWSYRGSPVPFVRYARATERMQHEGVRGLYAASLEADPDAVRAAEIPVEKTHGAILLVSAGQDGVWPSSEMAGRVMERLRANRFAYPYQHLEYPDAGHAIMGLRDVPAVVKSDRGELRFGGTDAANASARVDAWTKVFRFLREHLG